MVMCTMLLERPMHMVPAAHITILLVSMPLALLQLNARMATGRMIYEA